MFRPLSLYVGLRYTRAKRRNHFVSFISLASMLGIALGVTVLITVLSVMNGFDFEIKNHFFNLANHVTVSSLNDSFTDYPKVEKAAINVPGVVAAAPFVSGQGMITNAGQVVPIVVTGVNPAQQANVSELTDKITQGSMSALKPGDFGMVIGEGLAMQLGVKVGSKITLITPQANVSPIGVLPVFKRFTVVGIFQVTGNDSFNSGMALININDAQKLFKMGDSVSGVRLKVKNLFDAPQVAQNVSKKLDFQYYVSNWTQEYGSFFHAIQMEKTMMFIILVLIIAVAAFNLVSTLVMVVADKRSEIAIMRTLGTSPGTVMRIFMVQGCVVGVIGTLFGLIGGVALAMNVTSLVNWLQNLLHTQFISSSVYFINYLPSRIEWHDVMHICFIALGLSLLATLYPAWSASRTHPAEALRYE